MGLRVTLGDGLHYGYAKFVRVSSPYLQYQPIEWGYELLPDVPLTVPGPGCYANCDGSTATPVLNVGDFVCFQSRFAAGDVYANCDGSTTPPVLNVGDFVCFQSRFAAGCR